MERNRNTSGRFSFLSAIVGALGSSWSLPNHGGGPITGGSRYWTKAKAKADAKRRHRANIRLRKNGGAPSERGRPRPRVKPSGTKAHKKATAGQLGVTRRGY